MAPVDLLVVAVIVATMLAVFFVGVIVGAALILLLDRHPSSPQVEDLPPICADP